MIDLHSVKTTLGSSLLAIALLGVHAPAATAADNPFTATAPGGYALAAAEGMSKCGGGMDKCGGNMKSGKKHCKMLRMDSNGDGKVSREEFMTGHEAMFDKMDSNGDGVLDESERGAHKGMKKNKMTGKCGQPTDAE